MKDKAGGVLGKCKEWFAKCKKSMSEFAEKHKGNKVVDFVMKNKGASIGGSAILVVAIVVLIVVGVSGGGSSSALAKNKVPEINTLIEKYYAAYAAGDMETLEAIAIPMSELEKSYIAKLSEYVDRYDGIEVYTSDGAAEGSFMVSVSLDMYFNDIQTAVPGLSFFYISKNESDGSYYIDNVYSQFNLVNEEQPLDPAIMEQISAYEQLPEVIALKDEVQKEFDDAVASNPQLEEMIYVTLNQAMQEWVASLGGGQTEPPPIEPEEPAEEIPPEEPAPPEEAPPEEAPPEEPAPPNFPSLPDGTVIEARQAFNIRAGMDVDTERVTTVDPGQNITVITSHPEGWTEVNYQGVTGFIRTDLLIEN